MGLHAIPLPQAYIRRVDISSAQHYKQVHTVSYVMSMKMPLAVRPSVVLRSYDSFAEPFSSFVAAQAPRLSVSNSHGRFGDLCPMR